jgi:hypothetical protein
MSFACADVVAGVTNDDFEFSATPETQATINTLVDSASAASQRLAGSRRQHHMRADPCVGLQEAISPIQKLDAEGWTRSLMRSVLTHFEV